VEVSVLRGFVKQSALYELREIKIYWECNIIGTLQELGKSRRT